MASMFLDAVEFLLLLTAALGLLALSVRAVVFLLVMESKIPFDRIDEFFRRIHLHWIVK